MFIGRSLFNRWYSVLKLNPSGKNSIRCQMYAKAEDHIELSISILGIPVTYSRHNGKMQHLGISWRNSCIWRLDFCKIIKSSCCFWMDHKPKNVCSLIDRFRTSECSDTLTLPFTSKTGQQTKYFFFFNWVLLINRGHILAFLIKIQVRSFKSSEHIRKEVDGPYFEVSAKQIHISDSVMTLQQKPEENMLQFYEFQIGSRFKDW